MNGDEDLELLLQAVAEHQNNVAPNALEGVQYIDDLVGSVGFSDVSPRGHAADLAQNAVPARTAASWLDGATAQRALARYAALPSVPMQLSLGTTTHLGGLDADTFSKTPFAPARTAPEAWFGEDIQFLKQTLAGKSVARKIDYYVLGAGVWKSTSVWPPKDVSDSTLHFSKDRLEQKVVSETVPLRPWND